MRNETLVDSQIRELIDKERIKFDDFISEGLFQGPREDAVKKLVQPATLDVPVGSKMWIMRGSVTPKRNQTVKQLIDSYGQKELDIRPDQDVVLNKDGVYLIKLAATWNGKDSDIHIRSNAKSTSGRIDLQARLITDNNPHYDVIGEGYSGELYLEVVPNSFHVILRRGTALNQIRFARGNPFMSDEEIITQIKGGTRMACSFEGDPLGDGQIEVNDGILLPIDLESPIVGYKAIKTNMAIDLQNKGQKAEDFFEPIEKPRRGYLVAKAGKFYLLSTRVACSIPPIVAGELRQFDPRAGNFNSHYAGFFDPGFGYGTKGEIPGATGTLEVRVHHADEIFYPGKTICSMRLERVSEVPKTAYGTKERGSNYAKQRGVGLPKYFQSITQSSPSKPTA